MNKPVERVRKNVRAGSRPFVLNVIESSHTMSLNRIACFPAAFYFAKNSGNPSQARQQQRMTRRLGGRVGRRRVNSHEASAAHVR